MVLVKVRRSAPEMKPVAECLVCGVKDSEHVCDHLLVGTPGAPEQDGGVCDACSNVLGQVAEKFGGTVTVSVKEEDHQPPKVGTTSAVESRVEAPDS
jgi:hypothetical protein